MPRVCVITQLLYTRQQASLPLIAWHCVATWLLFFDWAFLLFSIFLSPIGLASRYRFFSQSPSLCRHVPPWFCLAGGCEGVLFHFCLLSEDGSAGGSSILRFYPQPRFSLRHSLAMGSLLEILSVTCPLTPLAILFPLLMMLLCFH